MDEAGKGNKNGHFDDGLQLTNLSNLSSPGFLVKLTEEGRGLEFSPGRRSNMCADLFQCRQENMEACPL